MGRVPRRSSTVCPRAPDVARHATVSRALPEPDAALSRARRSALSEACVQLASFIRRARREELRMGEPAAWRVEGGFYASPQPSGILAVVSASARPVASGFPGRAGFTHRRGRCSWFVPSHTSSLRSSPDPLWERWRRFYTIPDFGDGRGRGKHSVISRIAADSQRHEEEDANAARSRRELPAELGLRAMRCAVHEPSDGHFLRSPSLHARSSSRESAGHAQVATVVGDRREAQRR